ncbi:unnamed protein product [Arctogadus glacialis]
MMVKRSSFWGVSWGSCPDGSNHTLTSHRAPPRSPIRTAAVLWGNVCAEVVMVVLTKDCCSDSPSTLRYLLIPTKESIIQGPLLSGTVIIQREENREKRKRRTAPGEEGEKVKYGEHLENE